MLRYIDTEAYKDDNNFYWLTLASSNFNYQKSFLNYNSQPGFKINSLKFKLKN